MNTYLIVIANVAILFLFYLLLRKKSRSNDIGQVLQDCQKYLENINESVKRTHEQNQQSFVKQYQDMNQRIERSFEAAANKTLANNVNVVQSVSSKSIEQCLKPLVEELRGYENKIEAMIKNESTERMIMSDVLKNVSEINRGFAEQSSSFTLALRGNIRALGTFGEQSLKTILESSGYSDKEYILQQMLSTPTTSCVKPDCTVLLPFKRAIFVDSKFSLNSFLNFQEATDDAARKEHAKELLKNIYAHVNELSKKGYETINEYQSLPFVLMYVPSDPALTLALSEDNTLVRSALEKNVLIVGPTTLMASLRTISFLWREEKQKEHYKEIAASGKALYEKFKLFVDRMKEVQKHFEKSNEALEVAFNHLNRGDKSLVAEAQVLKSFGINTEKEVA